MARIQQRARERLEAQRLEPAPLAVFFECRERHVGGDVALARIFQHRLAGLVAAVAHQRSARKPGGLASGVAVIDGEDQPALEMAGYFLAAAFHGEFKMNGEACCTLS